MLAGLSKRGICVDVTKMDRLSPAGTSFMIGKVINFSDQRQRAFPNVPATCVAKRTVVDSVSSRETPSPENCGKCVETTHHRQKWQESGIIAIMRSNILSPSSNTPNTQDFLCMTYMSETSKFPNFIWTWRICSHRITNIREEFDDVRPISTPEINWFVKIRQIKRCHTQNLSKTFYCHPTHSVRNVWKQWRTRKSFWWTRNRLGSTPWTPSPLTRWPARRYPYYRRIACALGEIDGQEKSEVLKLKGKKSSIFTEKGPAVIHTSTRVLVTIAQFGQLVAKFKTTENTSRPQ